MEWEIDLWAPYKAELEDLSAAYEKALCPDVPFSSGLTLTLDTYFDQRVSFYAHKRRRTFRQTEILTGIHRRMFYLKTSGDILVAKSLPLSKVLHLNLSTERNGVTTTLPTIEVI